MAVELWDQVRTVSWSALYPTWHLQHPPAACEQFVAPPDEVIDGTGGTEEWSHRCSEASATTKREWFFYAFNSRPPIAERLEQFRVSVGGLPVDQLETVARELSRLASSAYGRPASDRIAEFGSSFWRQTARWRTSEVELVIGVDEFPNRPPHLNVFVRHGPLQEVLAIRRRLDNDAVSREAEPGTLSAVDLARQVQTEFPEAASLLTASPDRSADQAGLVKAITSLLDGVKTSSAERAGQLTWAAERLAGRLAMTERQSVVGDRQRAQLAAYSLTFEWDELGGGWAYAHDLLWKLWAIYPSTPWGQRAFATLLARGWDTRVGCPTGSDRFQDAIANGEAFLRANPRTPLRAQILLVLAQAYETWWSLSLASDRDDYADRRKYQVGALSARERAIRVYDELAQQYARSQEGDYARLALPRLHLGIDTGQRRFFCVYD